MMEKYSEIYDEYMKGSAYKTSIGLYDTVKQNENFFVGKQWEGVVANGLPTPVFNFLKRVILYLVSSTMSDSIKLTASSLSAAAPAAVRRAEVINSEFEHVFESCGILAKLRLFLRNAAVDGDGAIYLHFDDSAVPGGAIAAEIIDNTRVFFGNPSEREVEKQPYIIIATHEYVDDLKRRALKSGMSASRADALCSSGSETDPLGVERAVLLFRLRRDAVSGRIFACEATESATIRDEWDTGLTRYPLIWMNWDAVKDVYHGQAACTGLIPNQIFVNKLFAMAMISLMTTAYPKIVFDSTRVASWDNRVGTAIPVAGGDVTGVASIINGAQISPQIHEFIDSAISYTRDFMGATDTALGNVQPNNTSAILALQRASQVPLELVRQDLYANVEQLGLIIIDMMAAFYGKRDFEGTLFDFASLRETKFSIKLDVGASAYWSEIASMQSLDNLMMQGLISAADYLERIPSGMIPKKEELIATLRGGGSTPPRIPPVQ